MSRIATRRTTATVQVPTPWWEGLYIAYDAVDAGSQADSYVNRSSPGTNDATVGSAPAWARGMGWSFNGLSQYLICNVVPGENWTLLCQFSHAINGGIPAGSLKAGARRFWLWPHNMDGRNYGYDSDITLSGYVHRGMMAVTKAGGYLNGVFDGSPSPAPSNFDFLAPRIGSLNMGSPGFWSDATVLRFALHNALLSQPQIAAIYAKMTQRNYYMVAFGDSITAGSMASDAAHHWTNLVAAAKGYSLTNAGLGATVLQNTVQTTVDTIGAAADSNGRDRYVNDVLGACPDVVCILYGLNDLRLNDAAFSAANFQTDLGEIVDGLTARGIAAQSIVIGSPPYIPAASYALYPPYDGGSTVEHAAYVAACAAVAAAKGTRYIDVYQWMIDHGGDALVHADGIHPNDAGHAAIADAFLLALR